MPCRPVGLTRFLDERRIEIDSNVVERIVRPIALKPCGPVELFAPSESCCRHIHRSSTLRDTTRGRRSRVSAGLRQIRRGDNDNNGSLQGTTLFDA
jgi:Transposase IS66 family